MVEKCKPDYQNVNTVKSFSEQSAATVQVMNRICQNEEYLYQRSEKLNYLSPPAMRKRFNPVLIDPDKSYGYRSTEDEKGNGIIVFDNNTQPSIPQIDFSDMSLIDEVNSTCNFESWKDGQGNFHHRAIVPHKTTSTLNTSCKNWDLEGVNSAWYCGFDKNKPYEIRPDWINDPFDVEIPGICRAQTIVIPSGITNTSNKHCFLEAVTLHLESQGNSNSNWASPLYVQLWNVESKNYPRTEYKNNQNVPISGEDTIYVPKGDPRTPLAQGIFYPSETSPTNFTVVFDRPVKVNSGEHYAIVLLSPLSHWDHAPRIGGWGRNCNVTKDNGGDAFLSEDNGQTWIRYGHNDDKLTPSEYKLGRLTPQDFAFQAHIRVYEDGYDNENTYYLYLKPIQTNPITSMYISYLGEGGASNEDGLTCEIQYSIDGKNWYTPETSLVTFSPDSNGNYPRILFLRAVLATDSTSEAPYLDWINVILTTELPKKLYVRTPFYNPKITPMLGANLWGRVYAPWELIPSNVEDVECKVEIIQDKISKEHFHIVTVDELDLFTGLSDEGVPILDSSELTGNSDSRASYLIDNPSIINKLKKHHVYVKPYTLNNVEHLFSFENFDNEGNPILGGLKLDNSPAYPLDSVIIQPYGTEKVKAYGEWYEFDVDYVSDTLTLTRSVLDSMPVGALSVSYNKVLIQDLTLDEVGDRVDDETGLREQGLILDYFKEQIFIGNEILESRKVPLRMVPLDPIREVKILRDDEEIELFEDVHYKVDYTSHELIFPVTNNISSESQLKLNDTVQVVYTPHIEETGIAIGYSATREDTNHQIKILPNYIEYK